MFEISTDIAKKANQTTRTLLTLAFLLGQTDIFSHFINVAKMKAGDKSQFNDFTTKSTKSKTRVRKTEKEEDAEMLAKDRDEEGGGEDEDTDVFRESPDCKLPNC